MKIKRILCVCVCSWEDGRNLVNIHPGQYCLFVCFLKVIGQQCTALQVLRDYKVKNRPGVA